MSEPADSPAPPPENTDGARGDTPSEPPRDADRPRRPETPMGDARPETAEHDIVPTETVPAPEATAIDVPAPDVPAQDAPAAAPAPAMSQATPVPPPPALQHDPRRHPAGPLSPAEYQRQAAYYEALTRPRTMIPPNPRWHRPDATPRSAVLILVIAVALFGGWAAFHTVGVGIGLALTGIALVAVPLAAGDWADLKPRLPGAVLVAALWSVAALRDAGWVVLLCTGAAFLLTPLVLAPQRRFSGTAVTVMFGWLEGLAEAFRWAARGRRAGRTEGDAGSGMRTLWVVLITVALLLVFGGLFAAADSTFADLLVRLLPEVSVGEFILRLMLAAILFPLGLLWAYTAVAKPRFDSERPEGEHRTVSRFELSVPMIALNLLFVAFIAVQLRVFIGGEDYVRETNGLTFAEYARQGFWQLSFVAALSLAVIAVAAWFAPKRTQADRWVARILLGTLCVLSMVVIASALYRMSTYAGEFGLTRMRVWIFTVEIWLAVLFALVIVCCWKLRANWLPRAVLASGALALLGMAAANPDALIARYNLELDRELDLAYLDDLSDDAVPEFADLTDQQLDCMLNGRYDKDRDLMAWNLGYQRAAELLKEHREVNGYCDWGDDDLDRYSDEYGAPPPEDIQETAENEDSDIDLLEDPPAEAFFAVENCEQLDAAQTGSWFGNELGEHGLEAGGSSNAFYSLEPPVSAWLTCGYFSGDLHIEGTLHYTESTFEASRQMEDGVDAHSDGGWLVQERSSGYVLSIANESGRQLQYYETRDNLLLYGTVFGSTSDATAEAAAADLTGQMALLYAAFA